MIKTGITGNVYIISDKKEEVERICALIGKSLSSVYFSKRYSVWAARVKDKRQKQRLRLEAPVVQPEEQSPSKAQVASSNLAGGSTVNHPGSDHDYPECRHIRRIGESCRRNNNCTFPNCPL